MTLVYRLFLWLLILLMALHPGAAIDVPLKSQEAADSLADSLAAWQKDGLEPLDEPGLYVKAGSLRNSPVITHMHNPSVLPKTGEKQKAGESPQADSRHSEMTGEMTKEDSNGNEHVESIFCQGAGCMIGIVIVLVVAPAAMLMGSLAICWWCERKRRRPPGDQQERAGLIGSDSRSSSPEPAPQ